MFAEVQVCVSPGVEFYLVMMGMFLGVVSIVVLGFSFWLMSGGQLFSFGKVDKSKRPR